MRTSPHGPSRRERRNRNVAIAVVVAMVLFVVAPVLAFLVS